MYKTRGSAIPHVKPVELLHTQWDVMLKHDTLGQGLHQAGFELGHMAVAHN